MGKMTEDVGQGQVKQPTTKNCWEKGPAPALFMFHIFLITGLVSSLTNILNIFLPSFLSVRLFVANFVLSAVQLVLYWSSFC